MAAWSKAWVNGRPLVGVAVSNPTGAWMSVVSVVCCVFSGRSRLIIHPEESYRV